MDKTVKQILGLQEHEKEKGKLNPEVVVYLNPDEIGNENGAHCGGCFFFHKPTSECFLTKPPACNAEKGVCSLFLGGGNLFREKSKPQPQELIPKESVGYIEKGPTKCETCEYFGGADYPGECSKIAGHIDANGCCNQWEPNNEEKE